MGRVLLSSIFLFAAFAFSACSDAASPDGNAVQVGNGDAGTLQNAEIPTEFTSAAQALEVGTRLFDQGETTKAIEVLLEAVKMDPDLAEAYFKLGVAYALVEADENSLDNTEETPTPARGTKKTPERKKNSEKAFEGAVTAYKKILAKNEEDHVAHFYLGLTYNKLNEDEEAAKSLREAVKLQPENTEYQTELGAIYIKLAKYHEAVAALKKALEIDPGNIDAEEMLEKAEAGKKRIEFDPPKKDEKQPANTTSTANSNSKSKPGDANSNTNTPAPAKPAKTPPAPARTPR
jgi:tetratricopeptide (TPR) repeat protein